MLSRSGWILYRLRPRPDLPFLLLFPRASSQFAESLPAQEVGVRTQRRALSSAMSLSSRAGTRWRAPMPVPRPTPPRQTEADWETMACPEDSPGRALEIARLVVSVQAQLPLRIHPAFSAA